MNKLNTQDIALLTELIERELRKHENALVEMNRSLDKLENNTFELSADRIQNERAILLRNIDRRETKVLELTNTLGKIKE